MGKDDKGNDKQFQRLNKPVYYKKPESPKDEKRPESLDDFKTYEKLGKPVYIRSKTIQPKKGKLTNEEDEYQPLDTPVFSLKDGAKPEFKKNKNIDEDSIFDPIDQPLYVKKSDVEDIAKKTEEKPSDDTKPKEYNRVDQPVFYKTDKKDDPTKPTYERLPKPVYKKPTKESSPEDKEYVPVEAS
jgi:hypothetical protein